MLFPILWPSSLPVVVVQPEERHANTIASVFNHIDFVLAMMQCYGYDKNIIYRVSVSVSS